MSWFGRRGRKPESADQTTESDIPAFYPTLYVSALQAAGKPVSEQNIAAVAHLTAINVALNAHRWFGALGDEDARARFDAQFNPAANQDRTWNVADDMVAFLWAWTSRCHLGLRDIAAQMNDTIISSVSEYGDELPPDLWSRD